MPAASSTVEAILQDLEGVNHWPYVQSVLPILADALEDAGDPRATLVRVAQYGRSKPNKSAYIRYDGVKVFQWFIQIGNYHDWMPESTEREVVAQLVYGLQCWLRHDKGRPFHLFPNMYNQC